MNKGQRYLLLFLLLMAAEWQRAAEIKFSEKSDKKSFVDLLNARISAKIFALTAPQMAKFTATEFSFWEKLKCHNLR